MRIGNGLQCWLVVVPDACSQGSRRRVHRREERTTPRRQHDGWPRLGPHGLLQRLLPSCALGAAVPVIQARLASARAQFLCHRALRSDGHSHGGACCSRGRGPSQGWGQAKTARARHAPRAPSQARSQNDAVDRSHSESGQPESGLAPPTCRLSQARPAGCRR